MSYRKKEKQNKTRFYVYHVKFMLFTVFLSLTTTIIGTHYYVNMKWVFIKMSYFHMYLILRPHLVHFLFPFYRRNDFLLIITTSGRDIHPIERLNGWVILSGKWREGWNWKKWVRFLGICLFLYKYQVKVKYRRKKEIDKV